MSRRKLTYEECIAVRREYQDGKGGYSTISEKYGVWDNLRYRSKKALRRCDGVPLFIEEGLTFLQMLYRISMVIKPKRKTMTADNAHRAIALLSISFFMDAPPIYNFMYEEPLGSL